MDRALFDEATGDVLQEDRILHALERLGPGARQALVDALLDKRGQLTYRSSPELDRLAEATARLTKLIATPTEAQAILSFQETLRQIEAKMTDAFARQHEEEARVVLQRAEQQRAQLEGQAHSRRRRWPFSRRESKGLAESDYLRTLQDLQQTKRYIADLITSKYRLRLDLDQFLNKLAARATKQSAVEEDPQFEAALSEVASARADARPALSRALREIAEGWLASQGLPPRPESGSLSEEPAPSEPEDSHRTDLRTSAARVPSLASTTDVVATSIPTAFISWAHGHRDWDQAAHEAWKQTLARFADALRRFGIDADIDLYHEHQPDINWQRTARWL